MYVIMQEYKTVLGEIIKGEHYPSKYKYTNIFIVKDEYGKTHVVLKNK